MTGGHFRLLNRILSPIEQVLEVNNPSHYFGGVVEAARDSLLNGHGGAVWLIRNG
jgi:hypothetical protein